MIYTLDVTSANGVPFRVVAIPASDEGPNRHRAPAGRDHAIVEFYDRRFDHEPNLGQFTGGWYSLLTLLGRQASWSGQPIGDRALCLDGGNAASWTVDAGAIALVRDWLMQLDERGLLA